MSAIAGIYHLNNEPVSVEHSRRMMQCLQKYPAADVQVWQKGSTFLGCHAQWITPESIGEQLPYYDYDRQLAITADAIIDNRKELFSLLQIDKQEQKEITDSKLILLAYDKWREDVPNRLVGDFAFMIWDEKQRKLFGARDFSGSRTLYYHRDITKFVFCTVMDPLLSLPYLNEQLNEQWLAEYLAVSGVIDTVDCSITPYRQIEQVPPSHSISVTREKLVVRRYCNVIETNPIRLKSHAEYVEALQEVFHEAVKCRLRTNRNVGTHLSGGLDSGSVASFAARELRNEDRLLHTFSYIPPKDFRDFTPKQLVPDESVWIKSTTQYIGGLKEHYLEFPGHNAFSEVNDFLEILETPYKYFENTFWQKGIYEKAAEEGMGVLLNGGRGNFTISWGPAMDYYANLLRNFKWIKLYRELEEFSKNTGGARFRRIPKLAAMAFPSVIPAFNGTQKYKFPSLINPYFAEQTGVFEKISQYGFDEDGWFSSQNVYEQRKRHFEDVSHWSTSNKMATALSLKYSLWERDPTNDLRVVRFCLSVPESQYIQNGMDRALVRSATKEYLPDKVRLNQKFRGMQGADWLHRIIPYWDEFTFELENLCEDKIIQQYVNIQEVRKVLKKVKDKINAKHALNPDFRFLMRAFIVCRYIDNVMKGGENSEAGMENAYVRNT